VQTDSLYVAAVWSQALLLEWPDLPVQQSKLMQQLLN